MEGLVDGISMAWQDTVSRSLMSSLVAVSRLLCRARREVLRSSPTMSCNLTNSEMRALARPLSISQMKPISSTVSTLKANIWLRISCTCSLTPSASEVGAIGELKLVAGGKVVVRVIPFLAHPVLQVVPLGASCLSLKSARQAGNTGSFKMFQ